MNIKLLGSVVACAVTLAITSHALADDKTSVVSDIVLVENGVSLAPIILPEKPTLFTRLAANDLADYIGKASGVKPPILEGLPNPVPEHAIWVGFQPKLRELFPNTDFDFKHPEEILIESSGKHLAIVGRDVWDPKQGIIKAGKTEKERSSYLAGFQYQNRDVEGFQHEYGTVNAIYTFLQNQLGVRWLWPGKEGEVVPKQARIAVGPVKFRYHPKLLQRHSIFANAAIFRDMGAPGNSTGDWVRRQRLQLDSLYVPGGHGFADWWDRFHESHPDYFALQGDGTRNWKSKPNWAKQCESNPAVWEQWVNDIAESLVKNPHRNVFCADMSDDYSTGICLCEQCRSWDSPKGAIRIWNYHGTGPVTGVALSDRQVTFANSLASKLKERFPDKDYKVMMRAYGLYRPAPIEAVPSDNVFISNTANCLFDLDSVDSSSGTGEKSIDQFDGWAKLTKNQIWRPNTGDPVRWQTGGPVDITGVGEVFRTMAAKDIAGIEINLVWFYWSTQGPLYYLMAQLAWNPDRKVDEIMDDYYKSGFGPAAEDIKAYWAMLEKTNRAMKGKDGKSWAEAFSPAFFQEAYALIEKSAEKATSAGQEYSERVAFVRAGLDYLQLNTESQALAKQLIETKNPDASIKEKMQANWEAILQIGKKYPEALNGRDVSGAAAKGKLVYIHPDANHKAIEEKRLQKFKAHAQKMKRTMNAITQEEEEE